MAKKRETRRQQRIQRVLKKRYGRNLWIMKVHGGPFQKSGIGDLVGCVFGLAFMFEVKEPDGEEAEIQKETLQDFKDAGGISSFIVEPGEAVRLIDKALAKTRRSRSIRFE